MKSIGNHPKCEILAMVLLMLISIISKPAVSQNEEKIQSLYGVNCVVPANIEPESEFTILFEIDKDAGYGGAMTIVQKLSWGGWTDYRKFATCWNFLRRTAIRSVLAKCTT